MLTQMEWCLFVEYLASAQIQCPLGILLTEKAATYLSTYQISRTLLYCKLFLFLKRLPSYQIHFIVNIPRQRQNVDNTGPRKVRLIISSCLATESRSLRLIAQPSNQPTTKQTKNTEKINLMSQIICAEWTNKFSSAHFINLI